MKPSPRCEIVRNVFVPPSLGERGVELAVHRKIARGKPSLQMPLAAPARPSSSMRKGLLSYEERDWVSFTFFWQIPKSGPSHNPFGLLYILVLGAFETSVLKFDFKDSGEIFHG